MYAVVVHVSHVLVHPSAQGLRYMLSLKLAKQSICQDALVCTLSNICFLGPTFVSDIAIFVLKRDVKLQLTNYYVV